jgi:hypothetical protein
MRPLELDSEGDFHVGVHLVIWHDTCDLVSR